MQRSRAKNKPSVLQKRHINKLRNVKSERPSMISHTRVRCMSSTSRRQSIHAPQSVLPINVRNSLTGEKQPLTIRGRLTPLLDPDQASRIPSHFQQGPEDALSWYACGPTVYDAAHIGHGRTYVCFDMIRRVIQDHFNIPLVYAMGVTDIDDKIIKRAKERNIPWLSLARHYEGTFFADLQALNVLPPGSILRVSEHVGDIIQYIGLISSNGYTYNTSDGVYFDVTKFASSHMYGKLRYNTLAQVEHHIKKAIIEHDPTLIDKDGIASPMMDMHNATSSSSASPSSSSHPDQLSATTGQGYQTTAYGKDEKRHPADFCLWKFQKDPLEPAFESILGLGRPGWHIECSAMTSSALGPGLDVHSGGIDLCFPHHCNEVAQCEGAVGWAPIRSKPHHNHAHGGDNTDNIVPWSDPTDQWCSVWLHTGHLHIAGLKMSKSLKNFITIQDLITDGWTSDEFRMLCCGTPYHDTLQYQNQRLEQCRGDLVAISNFFESIQIKLKSQQVQTVFPVSHTPLDITHISKASSSSSSPLLDHPGPILRPSSHDHTLQAALNTAQNNVNAAFADDFDFPTVVKSLQKLMTVTSRYLNDSQSVSLPCLAQISTYILSIYNVMGFQFAGSYATNWADMAQGKSTMSHGQSNTTTTTSSSSSSDSQPMDSETGTPLSIRALADHRSTIKTMASVQKKAIKGMKNSLQSSPTQTSEQSTTDIDALRARIALLENNLTQAIQHLDTSSTTLLSQADSIRDTLLPQCGFILKDTSSVSTSVSDTSQPATSQLPYFIRPLRSNEM